MSDQDRGDAVKRSLVKDEHGNDDSASKKQRTATNLVSNVADLSAGSIFDVTGLSVSPEEIARMHAAEQASLEEKRNKKRKSSSGGHRTKKSSSGSKKQRSNNGERIAKIKRDKRLSRLFDTDVIEEGSNSSDFDDDDDDDENEYDSDDGFLAKDDDDEQLFQKSHRLGGGILEHAMRHHDSITDEFAMIQRQGDALRAPAGKPARAIVHTEEQEDDEEELDYADSAAVVDDDDDDDGGAFGISSQDKSAARDLAARYESMAQSYDDDMQNEEEYEQFSATAGAMHQVVPTAQGPQFFLIGSSSGHEAEVCYDFLIAAQERRIPIFSAFYNPAARGVYVEARSRADVTTAMQGMSNVFFRQPKHVPVNQMAGTLQVLDVGEDDEPTRFEPGTFVRFVKSGPNQHDLALVVAAFDNASRALVQLVPRIDYAEIAKQFKMTPAQLTQYLKQKSIEAKKAAFSTSKPRDPQALFKKSALQRFKQDIQENVTYRGPWSTFISHFAFTTWNHAYYHGGFQFRLIHIDDVLTNLVSDATKRIRDDELRWFSQVPSVANSTEAVLPIPDQRELFLQAQTRYETQLASFVAEQENKSRSTMQTTQQGLAILNDTVDPLQQFAVGERVTVVRPALRGFIGTVSEINHESRQVHVHIVEKEYDFDSIVPFSPEELSKVFKDGDHVRIIQPNGEFDGYTGTIFNSDPTTAEADLHFDSILGRSVHIGFEYLQVSAHIAHFDPEFPIRSLCSNSSTQQLCIILGAAGRSESTVLNSLGVIEHIPNSQLHRLQGRSLSYYTTMDMKSVPIQIGDVVLPGSQNIPGLTNKASTIAFAQLPERLRPIENIPCTVLGIVNNSQLFIYCKDLFTPRYAANAIQLRHLEQQNAPSASFLSGGSKTLSSGGVFLIDANVVQKSDASATPAASLDDTSFSTQNLAARGQRATIHTIVVGSYVVVTSGPYKGSTARISNVTATNYMIQLTSKKGAVPVSISQVCLIDKAIIDAARRTHSDPQDVASITQLVSFHRNLAKKDPRYANQFNKLMANLPADVQQFLQNGGIATTNAHQQQHPGQQVSLGAATPSLGANTVHVSNAALMQGDELFDNGDDAQLLLSLDQ